MKYYLACCDDDGKCIGLLTENNTVCKDPDNNMDKLMSFKKKGDASEKCWQINFSYLLFPDGIRYPFRVTPVRI